MMLRVDVRHGILSLFSYTPLQTGFGLNMLALDYGRPELMNLKHVITSFFAEGDEGGDDVSGSSIPGDHCRISDGDAEAQFCSAAAAE